MFLRHDTVLFLDGTVPAADVEWEGVRENLALARNFEIAASGLAAVAFARPCAMARSARSLVAGVSTFAPRPA